MAGLTKELIERSKVGSIEGRLIAPPLDFPSHAVVVESAERLSEPPPIS
jgi:hypothetical protein